jgi:hypothetical protein
MKKINSQFIKSMIESDLCFVNNKYKTTPYKSINFTKSLIDNKSNTLLVLDLLKLNSDIKCFSRFLQSLKFSRKRRLIIYCENKHYLNLFSTVISQYDISTPIDLVDVLPKQTFQIDENVSLICIGEPKQSFKNLVLPRLIKNNIFLITNAALSNSTNCFGSYRLTVDLDSLKKIIFFLLLILNNLRNVN